MRRRVPLEKAKERILVGLKGRVLPKLHTQHVMTHKKLAHHATLEKEKQFQTSGSPSMGKL